MELPAFVKEHAITWPMAVDAGGKTAAAWQARGAFTYYLIDAEGNLRIAGVFPPQLDHAIALLLAEKKLGKIVKKFELKHQQAEQVIEILNVTLGLNPKGRPKSQEAQLRRQTVRSIGQLRPDGDKEFVPESPLILLTIGADHKSLYAHAPQQQIDLIGETIAQIDVPK